MTVVFLLVWLAAAGAPRTASGVTAKDFPMLEALHRALEAGGDAPGMMELLRAADTRASPPGTPAEELLTALARQYGQQVTVLPTLTVPELQASTMPLLLSLRAAVDAKEEDRRIVYFAPSAGAAAHIYIRDTPVDLSWTDLARLWDGRAYVVSASAAPVAALAYRHRQLYWAEVAVGGLICAGVVLMGARLRWRRSGAPARGVGGQVLALCGAGVLLAGGAYVLRARPLLATVGEVASGRIDMLLDMREAVPTISKIDVREIAGGELKTVLAGGKALFVDARTEEEFDLSRVDGALSLPTFSDAAIRLNLAGIPKEQLIVVYCIDPSCPRGRAAASSLMRAGFGNVSVFKPGWQELRSGDLVPIDKSPRPALMRRETP
jgi:rhodanese-related sulfurtransferase